LQELVYKQGQAGVTKASVTIVFNNPDPATGPLGYEAHKQITVTRQVSNLFKIISYVSFDKCFGFQ
jgi:structural maintenance of chromosome 2